MVLTNLIRKTKENLNKRGIVRRRHQGWIPQIIPYSGYGSTNAVKILARAVMAEPEGKRKYTRFNLDYLEKTGIITTHTVRDFAELAIETRAEAQRGWRQFFTTQVGFLPVEIHIGKQNIKARTDRNGYLDVLVENHGLSAGWHNVKIVPLVGNEVTAPILIISADVKQGIISDIDDTIMVTWLPRKILAAWNSFVIHTNTRQAVAGMADFYHHILAENKNAPIFYLSTGAWNAHSTLLEFIRTYRFPLGPLLMTDWGPTPTGLFRSGIEHKKTQLRNLLIMFPNIKWVLVGDDGQNDPLIYDDLAREHPSRVKGIALRELNPVEQVLSHGTVDPSEGNREDTDIEEYGIPVIRGKDGYELLAQISRIKN